MTGETLKPELTEAQYRGIDLLSSSDLRDFATDRRKFYRKNVLTEEIRERKDKLSPGLLIGNMVHTLLLEEDTFYDKFCMSTGMKVPSGKMLEFVELLYEKTEENLDSEGNVTKSFADLCIEAYEESSFDRKRSKFETVINNFLGKDPELYYKQLRDARAKGLEIITEKDINISNKIIDIGKSDPFIGNVIRGDEEKGIEYINEKKVEQFELFGVKMKAMLDRLRIDHIIGSIQLYDYKIVYDNQSFYRNYYLYMAAYIQGYVYYKALLSGKADLGFDYTDFEILPPIFVAIDSGCFYRPLQYQMTTQNLLDAEMGFEVNGYHYKGVKEILEEIEWCNKNGIWDIPMKSYLNNGFKELK